MDPFPQVDRRSDEAPPVALAPELRLTCHERVLAQEAEGTLVLLDLDHGSYFALDEVGARAWQLCDGERSVEAVLATLCSEYDAPAETVRRDVSELLEALLHERLLVARA